MDCNSCKHKGFVGHSYVCGYLLHGGETVFIHNGEINEPCPLENKDNQSYEIKK